MLLLDLIPTPARGIIGEPEEFMGLEIILDDDGDMRVHIPGSSGRGHDVYIPLTLEGVRVLKKLLMERKSFEHAKIGEPGSPTNHQIKMWLAREKQTMPKGQPTIREKVKERIEKRKVSLDLNIDIGDIQL